MRRKLSRHSVAAGLVLLMPPLTQGCVDTGPPPATNFSATVNGASQTPPVTTAATGQADFHYVGTSIRYTISVTHLSGAATASHIHFGVAGSAGLTMMNLCGTSDTQPCASDTSAVTLQGSSSILSLVNNYSLDGLLQVMRDTTAYVDVHTATNPGGEIRGQIRPIS